MTERPKDISVMTSHFQDVLGVEPDEDVETKINAETIIQAFNDYEGADLEEKVGELLSRIAAELSLMNLKGLKGLYKFAENDDERNDALESAGKLKAKLDFFSYLLSQPEMRELIVRTYTNADADKRHGTPQFQEAAAIIQNRINDYNNQVEEFKRYVIEADKK